MNRFYENNSIWAKKKFHLDKIFTIISVGKENKAEWSECELIILSQKCTNKIKPNYSI